MSKADTIVWILAIAAVLVTFMNPGGLIIGLLVGGALLAGYYGTPFFAGLFRDRQRGTSAAKVGQGSRKRLRGGDRE